jgi:hypothetical protein
VILPVDVVTRGKNLAAARLGPDIKQAAMSAASDFVDMGMLLTWL